MFRELVSIFIEHAGEDAFPLIPGHSYFLEADEAEATLPVSQNPSVDICNRFGACDAKPQPESAPSSGARKGGLPRTRRPLHCKTVRGRFLSGARASRPANAGRTVTTAGTCGLWSIPGARSAPCLSSRPQPPAQTTDSSSSRDFRGPVLVRCWRRWAGGSARRRSAFRFFAGQNAACPSGCFLS